MRSVLHVTGQGHSDPRVGDFTDTSALEEGVGLCFDRDYGTATSSNGNRDHKIQLPTTSNNMWFAGVSNAYRAGATAGQPNVEFSEPGSFCKISVLEATTVGVTRLTALAGSGAGGRFVTGGMIGRGSALALQTVAAITSTSTTTPGPISSSLDGSAVVSADGLTVTKTGLFTYAAAGDYLYIVAGGTTATSAAAVTVGRYTIASRTSADVAVLTSSCASAASSLACYLVRGNCLIDAVLDNGPESGLIEWVTPLAGAAAQSMVGGVTNIFGGHTVGTGDSTATLADGTRINQRKAFWLRGALTTNDWLLTTTTARVMVGNGTVASTTTAAIATVEFDAANDYALFDWSGKAWMLQDVAGVTLA